MSRPPNSIDPLEAKVANSSTAAQAALKREIENILTSYVGWFDPFAELIQNALDSVEERIKSGGENYTPTIHININLANNSLTVSDNGTGLSQEKYRQFLAPSFSFKSGKTRGHKGVGATFLAYGYNYIQIATKTSDYEHVGKMENARKWLTDLNPASNPLIVPDKAGCHDTQFSTFDYGVSVTLKFDPTTFPGDLNWLKAQTAEVWKAILLLKTGLGAILEPLKITLIITVVQPDLKESQLVLKELEYLWPHKLLAKSQRLRDVQKKADELHAKSGKDYRMPASYRNLDCLYERLNSSEIAELIDLLDDEKELVKKFLPTLYLCYVHSARVWSDYNTSLEVRGSIDILKPGIQICANDMPQGEIIQIPLKRNVGRQNQVHFVAHFENCKADLGRKGFQKEILQFCEEISKRLIEGPFQKQKHTLKAATGAKTDLKRESDIDEWKMEMQLHETNKPLKLTNPNFFLPMKQIAITSVPTREQDVIALFNQLIAGGVIRGIKIMSTNERFTYDGMYRVSFVPPKENHIYEVKTNPLGVITDNFQEGGFETKPKILEYKLVLDGLVEDLESGEKNAKDIGLVIVWETGNMYQQSFSILSLLDPGNLSERQYHGVTHVIQESQTGARVMDLIVLSELIEFLNDSLKETAHQKEKYDV